MRKDDKKYTKISNLHKNVMRILESETNCTYRRSKENEISSPKKIFFLKIFVISLILLHYLLTSAAKIHKIMGKSCLPQRKDLETHTLSECPRMTFATEKIKTRHTNEKAK